MRTTLTRIREWAAIIPFVFLFAPRTATARPVDPGDRSGCQACGASNTPWHLLKIDGHKAVRACIAPDLCRKCAQTAGIWRV